MKKAILNFWPLAFIFLIWFIFANPYFLKNKVPYPSKYQVNFFGPWSYYEKFWGPVKNNAMPDVIGQIYPWRYFAIQSYKSGQIPFWNPYRFAGSPHLANYQSAVFSPFNLLFFVLPFIDAWSILVLIQPLMAGLFTYFLMREFKVSHFGSVISGVSFMFCGFIVVWMAYGTLPLAIVFLPLSVLAIEKIFKKPSFMALSVLILSVPFSFFSGHFQTSLYYLAFIILFFIYKLLKTGDIKKALTVITAVIIGILFSFPQIIPSIQFYSSSVRSEIFIKGGGIPLFYLVNIFSPDFFGNPVTRNDWFGYYAEWASFIGIIPLLLALYAIIAKKNLLSVFFVFGGLLALLLAADTPLLKFIALLKLPVLSTSAPSRIIVLFSFSFTVLAGFGLDNLNNLIKEKKIKKIIGPLVGVGIILIIVWILLLIVKVLPVDKLIIAKRNMVLPTIFFALTSLVVFLNLKLKNKMLLIFSSFIFVFLVGFDSFRFAQKWMPFDPKELVFSNIPIIEAMKKNINQGRFFGNLGGEVDTYYGFSSIEGYDPLYIQRFGEFLRSAEKGEFAEAERSVARLSKRGKYTNRVLDLLGVNLIFHPIADTNQTWAYPVWQDKNRFSLVYQDDKFQLFQNNLALPRASLFYDFEVIKDNKKIINRFYSDDFDFRKKTILEEKINDLKQGEGKAKILEYTPNKVKIEVETDKQGILFLSDNYYPGWKATINGVEAKIYRADYSFRAVVVPEGRSMVEFTYLWFF